MKDLLQTYTRLTERQQQVIRFVTYGYSNREIGEHLYITGQVVAEHLTVIYDELHIILDESIEIRPNRAILIRYFTMLFHHYPELLPDDEAVKM